MDNLSLLSIAKLALKNLYIIVTVFLVCAICAFSYCYFVATPVYKATGSILVTNGAIINSKDITDSGRNTKYVSGTDITASLSLCNTVTDILNTNGIYKELSSKENNKFTYQQLKQKSTVARRGDETLFIDISFNANTKEEAIRLVNAYLSIVPDYIEQYIPSSTTAVTTTADYALKILPRTLQMTALAAILGAAVSIGIITLIYMFNNTIKDETEFKENYDITVIGSIPDFVSANSKYYKSYSKGGY